MTASRIADAFQAREHPLLVACTVAGDPDYEASLGIVRELVASGGDIIELVMPFSDPVADGPVMQQAAARALSSGMNTDRLFCLIRDIRSEMDVPLIILTYANIVFQRGISRFYRDAAAAGADGVAVADVPVEEAGPFRAAAAAAGIDHILFASQTTSEERLSSITEQAGGFIYLVAAMGVTGVREEIDPGILSCVKEVKRRSGVPVVPGFGISTSGQIRAYAAAGADGVIVGSAIVGEIGGHAGDRENLLPAVRRVMNRIRPDALRED
jgi:tryptophan synthase alpha chain